MRLVIRAFTVLLLGPPTWMFSFPHAAQNTLDSYDIVWTSQSRNAAESMPVGGGEVGLNVWVENNDVLVYLGQSGTFDENNQMLKPGRVRLRLEPNPFATAEWFRQELKLRQGLVEISAGGESGQETTLRFWVEIFRPVAHIEVQSRQELSVTAHFESWRTGPRELPADCRRSRFPCMSLVGYPGPVTLYADHVEHQGDSVLWYHRNNNRDLVFDKEIEQQGLREIARRFWNPLFNRTFGGVMRGEGFESAGTTRGKYASTNFVSWKLQSRSASTRHRLGIYLHTDQSESISDWKSALEEQVREADRSLSSSRESHREWWSDFWSRSYLFINSDRPDPDDPAWQVGRNYQLFRYMLACNAFGKWPTKFNGSFFTYDPLYVASERGAKTETPDFRTWGGGSFTAQNQRLVYWPMLRNGDFDLMPPQFDFYRNSLAAAELRTRHYWGHAGSSFTEQLENFGLPVGSLYGWEGSSCRWGARDPEAEPGVQSIGVVYQYGHQLDFSFMILEYHRYSGRDITPYMPFIDSAVTFFDEHYRYRKTRSTGTPLDEQGRLVIYPSRACESYVDARNPADVIAGMNAVLERLLELPDRLVPRVKKENYREILERLPPLPVKEKDGRRYLAGAESWSRFAVGEIPELYAVFPYDRFGIGLANLELPLFTWTDALQKRQKNMSEPWYQGGIFAARLGLTEEAREVAIFKLADSNQRFPAFHQTDDWAPDHNWMGAGMIGLQEMLMQTPGREIHLFPAWPVEWDVEFRLHAPFGTTVEGLYRRQKLESLRVSPETRIADIRHSR